MDENSEQSLQDEEKTAASGGISSLRRFQETLTPEELPIFFTLQNKFEHYLRNELKNRQDQVESGNDKKEEEIKALLLARQEDSARHVREMDNLRKYFEAKFADLEKQFAENILSEKSETLTESETDIEVISAKISRTLKQFRMGLPLSPQELLVLTTSDTADSKIETRNACDFCRKCQDVIIERNLLRELLKIFRSVLADFAKCVINSEEDLSATLLDKVHHLLQSPGNSQPISTILQLNISAAQTSSLNGSLVSYAGNLLEVLEDPHLVQYVNSESPDLSVAESSSSSLSAYNLKECLDRLHQEALNLLTLFKQTSQSDATKQSSQRLPTIEEEAHDKLEQPKQKEPNQIGDGRHVNGDTAAGSTSSLVKASEIITHAFELKNKLQRSESYRKTLQEKLEQAMLHNSDLANEVQRLREQLSRLSAEITKGYGNGNSGNQTTSNLSRNFSELRDRAQNILSSSRIQQQEHASSDGDDSSTVAVLLQVIEDFCREGDNIVEFSKHHQQDLQAQIETADRQLKATRQFLEEQAAEREQEHEELCRKIELLKAQLSEKNKDRSSRLNASPRTPGDSVDYLDNQIESLRKQLEETTAERNIFESKLKASLEQIFGLREIISELETHVEMRSLNEMALSEKIKQLEDFIDCQTRPNESLDDEADSFTTESEPEFQERIRVLEKKLQDMRPAAEESVVLKQIIEGLQRIVDRLSGNTRFEGTAVKRIRDLEMQVSQIRDSYENLRSERDSLRDRVIDQTRRISNLQILLEEQERHGATHEFKVQLHDLKSEVQNLEETLSVRDKQIDSLNRELEKSKTALEDLEARLASYHQADCNAIERLEREVMAKNAEIQKLHEEIKAKVIGNKVLQNILSEKNKEVGYMRQLCESREQGQPSSMPVNALYYSFLGNEIDEPEAIRRGLAKDCHTQLSLDLQTPPTWLQTTAESFRRPQSNDREATLLNHPAQGKAQAQPLQKSESLQPRSPVSDQGRLSPHLISFESPPRSAPQKKLDATQKEYPLHKPSEEQPNILHYVPGERNRLLSEQEGNLNENFQEQEELQNRKVPEILQFRRELQIYNEKLRSLEYRFSNSDLHIDKLQRKLVALEQTLASSQQLNYKEQEELRAQLRELQMKVAELKKPHQTPGETQNRTNGNSKQCSVNEISRKAAKESSYATHLDSNILRVIDSEDENNLDLKRKCSKTTYKLEATKTSTPRSRSPENPNTGSENFTGERELLNRLESYRVLLDVERENSAALRAELNVERQKCQQSQEQDILIIRELHTRLQIAMEQRAELQQLLEAERTRAECLTENLQQIDRWKEKVHSEIVSLRAQNELERKRCADLESECNDLRHCLNLGGDELGGTVSVRSYENLQRLLEQQNKQIESLKSRYAALQEVETRRSAFCQDQVKEKAKLEEEVRNLRNKLIAASNERESSAKMVAQLQQENETLKQPKPQVCPALAQAKASLESKAKTSEGVTPENSPLGRRQDRELLQQKMELQAHEIKTLQSRLTVLQELENDRMTRFESQARENAKLLAETKELRRKLLEASTDRVSLGKTVALLQLEIDELKSKPDAEICEALLKANASLSATARIESKVKKILNAVIENSPGNQGVTGTVELLMEERRQLQKLCDDLKGQLQRVNSVEQGSDYHHLLRRYLRLKSHCKALIYQKRFLKLSLKSYIDEEFAFYQANNLRALRQKPEGRMKKRSLFKTVANAAVSIHRMKSMVNKWKFS